MYDTLLYDVRGAAAVITLNRPDRLNACTRAMIGEISQALATAEQDEDVTGIVLTGAGRGFCAGMDMDALDTMSSKTGREAAVPEAAPDAHPGDPSMGEDFISGLTYMMTVRKPIIAAVNGACAGYGLSIALLCDMRFAADTAKFVTSFSARGLVAEHGQSWILPRVIGPSKALDLLWSSRPIMANEALEIGLVDRVCPAAGVVDAALHYIEDLARTTAPLSLMHMKRQVYRHLNMSLGEAMMETEALMATRNVEDDFREGVASFREKRLPQFDRIKLK